LALAAFGLQVSDEDAGIFPSTCISSPLFFSEMEYKKDACYGMKGMPAFGVRGTGQ